MSPRMANQHQTPWTRINNGGQSPQLKYTHKGPKIVARFQGLEPPDGGSGKLIEVGILSGSLRESSKQVKQIDIHEIPYSIFGLEGLGRLCSS